MSSEDLKELSVLEILQRIRNGIFDPKLLSKKQRQACVEALIIEGWQQSNMAELFKTSDRTIRRDLNDIYERNAIEATPELTKVLVGELVLSARGHCARIKQLSRSAEASVIDKVKAEYLGWKIQKDLLETLNSVGYLVVERSQVILSKNKPTKPEIESKEMREARIYLDALRPMDRQKFIDNLTRVITQMETAEGQEASEGK